MTPAAALGCAIVKIAMGQVSHRATDDHVYALLNALGVREAVVDVRGGRRQRKGLWFIDMRDDAPDMIAELEGAHNKLQWSFDGETVVDLRPWKHNKCDVLPLWCEPSVTMVLHPVTIERSRK